MVVEILKNGQREISHLITEVVFHFVESKDMQLLNSILHNENADSYHEHGKVCEMVTGTGEMILLMFP